MIFQTDFSNTSQNFLREHKEPLPSDVRGTKGGTSSFRIVFDTGNERCLIQ